MKILGMIGGTGLESTVEYYRRLIGAYHARVSESGAPPIIINSVDNKNLVKWFTAGGRKRGGGFFFPPNKTVMGAGGGFGPLPTGPPPPPPPPTPPPPRLAPPCLS